MGDVMTCRVTQLLYVPAPQLNFAKVISDLQKLLAAPGLAAPALSWDCDDIAVLDFNTGRVIIGFSENLPGDYQACLTIAAGQSPLKDALPLAKADQDLLCQGVAERLERHFPSDAQRSQIIHQPLTPDLIDHVVDRLFQLDDDGDYSDDSCDPEIPALALSSTDPGDMDRLMRRLSTELVARTPNLIARAIAQATPKGLTEAKPKASASSTVLTGSDSKKAIGISVFWQKSKGSEGLRATTQFAKVRASSTELQAVRDALYATDQAGRLSPGRLGNSQIAAQAFITIQALAALPAGLATAVANMRRADDTRIRH